MIEDWDFAEAKTDYMTHGFHIYPARMIPQVAERLIIKFYKPSLRSKLILDPFCGSGGVLVEAILKDIDAIGIDLNPLACLLARVKTTPIEPDRLYSTFMKIWNGIKTEGFKKDWIEIQKMLVEAMKLKNNDEKAMILKEVKIKCENLEVEIPDISNTNLFYWFKPNVIKDLLIVKKYLSKIQNEDEKNFFNVCFSATIRAVSGTRKGEFKLYRMPLEEWERFNPNVFETFRNRVLNNISKMAEFFNAMKNKKAKAYVFEFDTRDLFSKKCPIDLSRLLKENSVNLIVTSPPYGDSHTTVAYGQFSRYSLVWLGYRKEDIWGIDDRSLGGIKKEEEIESESLKDILKKIKKKSRVEEVKSFFIDLKICLEKLSKLLTNDGHACFVLGNRTVNGWRIPTDEILIELSRPFGLKHIKTYYRNIPSKRIPWKSSPTNISGQKVETINKESIVILRKT
jgi:hypothetical protein